MDARDHLKQFPDEPLKVASCNKLFCKACRETISLKKSIIASHIKCAKHSTRLQDISDMLTLSVKICSCVSSKGC